jgi:acyl-[acyl-carrier-protein]-phospholipid O-acyltransferase/long-chain-fatty-acid--[acyl-carrier-protein] ligase
VPGHFARVIGLSLLRIFYRFRSVGAENIPKTGGVLLLPNHVSWADAFFITAASPRPVRFVMDAIYMEKPAIRWFCTLFETVPIDLGKPREAMRTASAALENGDLVCLFPEGQLTRTGTLQELKRGFGIIARQANAPVVPAWLDGAWGSIFSYEGNRYFRKRPHRIPYGMALSFGEVIEPKNAAIDTIRHGILKASADAVEARIPTRPRSDEPAIHANGYQLGQINALPRRHPFARLQKDTEIDNLKAIAIFAKLFKVPIQTHLHADADTHSWVGGSALRESILAQPTRGRSMPFYDFSAEALEPLDHPDFQHYPCLAINGIIVAMSFPDPPHTGRTTPTQRGSKPGTYGQLLPGFDYTEQDGITTLHGPAAGPNGLPLPTHLAVDEQGFVGPPSS